MKLNIQFKEDGTILVDYEHLGQWLEIVRGVERLSRKEAAALIGRSKEWLYYRERAQGSRLTVQDLSAWADALGYDTKVLLIPKHED